MLLETPLTDVCGVGQAFAGTLQKGNLFLTLAPMATLTGSSCRLRLPAGVRYPTGFFSEALSSVWCVLASWDAGTLPAWHGVVMSLLMSSRLAPAPPLPGRSLVGLEFSSWKARWGVEEKEFGVYRALKTKCSFSLEDFRIGLGEGSKELVER